MMVSYTSPTSWHQVPLFWCTNKNLNYTFVSVHVTQQIWKHVKLTSARSNVIWSWWVSPESSKTFHDRGGEPNRFLQSFIRSPAKALSGAMYTQIQLGRIRFKRSIANSATKVLPIRKQRNDEPQDLFHGPLVPTIPLTWTRLSYVNQKII